MALPTSLGKDATADVFLQDSLWPTIAEHALKCDSLFRKYMAIPEIIPDPTVMDDQLARFTLWASNMDVYGPLNISLDYRLRYSAIVVDIIHQLLDVICHALTSLKQIDGPPQSPSRKKQRISEKGDSEITKRAGDNASESDSDEHQAEDNISKITHTVGGTVTRLFRLSNAIRKSAAADRAHKIRKYTSDEDANSAIAELRLYTDCYVRFRFPSAPGPLRSALIEANALRLRRLYYQRSHRRRIDLSVQQPPTNPGNIHLPKIANNTPAVRFTPNALGRLRTVDAPSQPPGPPPAPVTNATTARQTAVRALYAKSTTEVPRAKSVLVNNKLSFPPMPPTNECPYCGVIVEFKSFGKSILWHDHVIRDLEPFICFFSDCVDSNHQDTGPSTFETSKAWISHLQNAHGSIWECRAPSHDPITFEHDIQYQEHSIKEHGVPEAHVATLSSAARRPGLNKVMGCPFGDDFQVPDNVEASTVFASEALASHIAAHLKEIALLTLQKLPSDIEDGAKSIDSGRPSEDEAPGLAKLRGSMYSVLDDESLDFQFEVGDNIPDYPEGVVSRTAETSGSDLDAVDAYGLTALHHAVLVGELLPVQSLIEQGASVYSRSDEGHTALHYASQQGFQSLDVMRLLLNSGAEPTSRDRHGQTPLHYAAEVDSIDAMELLVDHGAEIEMPDINGFSPYLWAVVTGQKRAVSLLLSLGADVNSTSADGKSAMGWAANIGHTSVAKVLLENKEIVVSATRDNPMQPLAEAAASGRLLIVELLLNHGADPNYRDRDGWSAIHWAAEEGHLEIVTVLFSRGADINAVSSFGTSPLHCAANGGHDLVVDFLLREGADCLKSTCHGWTPIHHAAFMGYSHVVQALIKYHQMDSREPPQDNHGWSVLHLAVWSRDLATVKALLDSSVVSRSLRDEHNLTAGEWLDLVPTSYQYKAIGKVAFAKSRCCRAVTALRQAVINENVPMIDLLLREGHSVNGEDSGRRTALYCAAKKGSIPIMDVLLNRGADPNILPRGCRLWEQIISSDKVISRLTQAGYRPQSVDLDTEHEIRRLGVRWSDPDIGSLTVQEIRSQTAQKFEPADKPDMHRSAMRSLWETIGKVVNR